VVTADNPSAFLLALIQRYQQLTNALPSRGANWPSCAVVVTPRLATLSRRP
jgi:hypothetical protein